VAGAVCDRTGKVKAREFRGEASLRAAQPEEEISIPVKASIKVKVRLLEALVVVRARDKEVVLINIRVRIAGVSKARQLEGAPIWREGINKVHLKARAAEVPGRSIQVNHLRNKKAPRLPGAAVVQPVRGLVLAAVLALVNTRADIINKKVPAVKKLARRELAAEARPRELVERLPVRSKVAERAEAKGSTDNKGKVVLKR